MPPYYAQQMISRHYQPLCIRAEADGAGDAIDITATRSEDGHTVVLKVVNLEAQDLPVSIDLGATTGWQRVTITSLTGPLEGANSPRSREGSRRWCRSRPGTAVISCTSCPGIHSRSCNSAKLAARACARFS